LIRWATESREGNRKLETRKQKVEWGEEEEKLETRKQKLEIGKNRKAEEN
jgi:hypothetical protein